MADAEARLKRALEDTSTTTRNGGYLVGVTEPLDQSTDPQPVAVLGPAAAVQVGWRCRMRSDH